ncbi:MAG: NAD-binding protein [Actinomycetota bacterium]
MRVIITGCGRVGSQLAQFFAYESHDVVVIDRDEGSFARLGGTFNGVTLTGVAFDEGLLKEAGIERAGAVAAVTNFDNTNLMVAEIARRIYGVPAVARLYNPEKRYIFNRLGVDHVCGTALVAQAVMGKLLQHDLIMRQERLDAGIRVVEFSIPPETGEVFAGNFEDGASTRILSLARAGTQIRWDRDTALRGGDRLVLAARREAWSDVEVGWTGFRPGKGRKGASFLWGVRQRREKRRSKAVIAGCGRVGAQLAEMLSLDGHEVTVIDRDAASFQRLFKMFPGRAVEGMSFDIDTLREAGIEEADAFAAVTNYDNANLMSAEVAREVFGVPRVVSRIYNPDKQETYRALGLDYVVGTELIARTVMEMVLVPLVRHRGTCCDGSLSLVEFDCPPRWAGRTMAWCEKVSPLWIAYLVREGEAVLPGPDTILEAGDEITALAREGAARRLERYLRDRGRR